VSFYTATDHCFADWLNQTEDLRFRKGGRKPPTRLAAGETLLLECFNIGMNQLYIIFVSITEHLAGVVEKFV